MPPNRWRPMAGAYQQFLDFDWGDETWRAYLNGLYPPPTQQQIPKFKKKWYKKNVDPVFDDSFEPVTSRAPEGGCGEEGGGSVSSASIPSASSALPNGVYSDASRWEKMGSRAVVCFVVYALALTIAVGAASGIFPPYQALVVLLSAFVLEILAKYGLKFKSEYVQSVLLDDVGVMPIMGLTLLTPGLHPAIRIFALASPFLTAVLTFAQICKACAKLPLSTRNFFSPLAQPSARYKLMQARAHVEVWLGFVLVAGVLTMRAAPISVLLYWNFMMMRYIMNSWTQAAFRKIDIVLEAFCGRIPGVRGGYAALKRWLYSFVDTESKKAGKMCTIL